MTGPGTANCTCNEGFIGDGQICHLATVCTDHGECDKNAQCILTRPGQVRL